LDAYCLFMYIIS